MIGFMNPHLESLLENPAIERIVARSRARFEELMGTFKRGSNRLLKIAPKGSRKNNFAELALRFVPDLAASD